MSSLNRSAPVAQGQPLGLPDTFARPSTGPRSASDPTEQWLDPQIVNDLALQASGEAEEEVGPWSL